MTAESQIPNLLLNCETSGAAPQYVDSHVSPAPISISSDGASIFVISDLHLASGKAPDGTYAGTENFFADASLKRFLDHAHTSTQPGKALLIINGDSIDFLRITEGPCADEDYLDWQGKLARIGLDWTIEDLKKSVTYREVKCGTPPHSVTALKFRAMLGMSAHGLGLQTHPHKSVWKLAEVIRGHSVFFEALAEWLRLGHKLTVVKGNHDLEWYWQPVRNYLRLDLADRLSKQTQRPIELELTETVLPNIRFIDDGMLIDGDFYVEHGHRFDKYTNVQGGPLLDTGDELNIPFGSFLNRYLINFVELDYPYLDNVRPSSNILPLMIRERFPLALKLLFAHVPFMLRIIPKRYYDYMFRRVIVTIAAVLLPVGVLIAVQWPLIHGLISDVSAGVNPANRSGPLRSTLVSFGSNFAWLILSYFLSRVVAYFHLEEPDSLASNARETFAQNPGYRIITFGHTHNPGQSMNNDRWFFNTGTWIPIVEISSADVRDDRTYTVLHLTPGDKGLQPTGLFRWDDDAGRLDSAVLVRRNGN